MPHKPSGPKPGEIAQKQFICELAAKLHKSESAIFYALKRGRIPVTRIRRINPRLVWITP